MPLWLVLLELKLNHIGQNFSLKPLKDKILPHSSTSVQPLHQVQLNKLLKKLKNNNLKRMIKNQLKKKSHHHQRNNKKMPEWVDYLIEIFKLYISEHSFVFCSINKLVFDDKLLKKEYQKTFIINY